MLRSAGMVRHLCEGRAVERCCPWDLRGLEIWGVPARVAPMAVIVLLIYEINFGIFGSLFQLLRISG